MADTRPAGCIERWAKEDGRLGIAARYVIALESALIERNTQVESLRAERDDLQADKERLDWLETQPGIDLHHHQPDYRWELVMGIRCISEHPDLREAIDAARSPQPTGPGAQEMSIRAIGFYWVRFGTRWTVIYWGPGWRSSNGTGYEECFAPDEIGAAIPIPTEDSQK